MAGSIAETVRSLAEPAAALLGLSIWDIEWKKEGASWVLRFFIDRAGGVSIDDCEAFSRAMDPLLDEADPIESSYCLEVSSPGVERKLTRPEHFPPYVGKTVRVSLFKALAPGKEFEAELAGFAEGTVTLLPEGGEALDIPLKDIANLTLKYDF